MTALIPVVQLRAARMVSLLLATREHRTPLAVAESRDPKGLYAKARAGKLPNFTGIDSPYEPPEHPELRLDAGNQSVAESAREILDLLD